MLLKIQGKGDYSKYGVDCLMDREKSLIFIRFSLLSSIIDFYVFLREINDDSIIIVVEYMKFVHGLIVVFHVPLHVIID